MINLESGCINEKDFLVGGAMIKEVGLFGTSLVDKNDRLWQIVWDYMVW